MQLMVTKKAAPRYRLYMTIYKSILVLDQLEDHLIFALH
jgi:hypothetical protein